MRFGIVLPERGPLAEPAAVAVAGRAAEELGYASVWSTSLARLTTVVAGADRVPVALLAPAGDSAAALRVGLSAVRGLGARMSYLAVRQPHLGALSGVLATRLLDTSEVAPTSGRGDGWSPLLRDSMRLSAGWRLDDPGRVLVARKSGSPTNAELIVALAAHADELVVALPSVRSLDVQLAGFADIAERLFGRPSAGRLARGQHPPLSLDPLDQAEAAVLGRDLCLKVQQTSSFSVIALGRAHRPPRPAPARPAAGRARVSAAGRRDPPTARCRRRSTPNGTRGWRPEIRRRRASSAPRCH